MRPSLALLVLALSGSLLSAGSLRPVDLRCNGLASPAHTSPNDGFRLTWRLEPTDPTARGLQPTATELQFADDPAKFDDKGDPKQKRACFGPSNQEMSAVLWLRQRKPEGLWWRVKIWDQDDQPSEWSQPAFYRSEHPAPDFWNAQWISAWMDRRVGIFDGTRRSPTTEQDSTSANIQNFKGDPAKNQITITPACYFRKEFDVAKPVERATLRATALGVYQVEINGKRVGDQVLAPGWTNYHKRVHYQTYDVTDHLAQGPNAIGATLCDGWYAGYVAYGLLTGVRGLDPNGNGRSYYGRTPAFLGQLEVEYADGSRETLATDTTWKCGGGPITESDILMGESFNARWEIPGWSKPGFNEDHWHNAEVSVRNGGDLQPHPGPPVRVIQEMPARTVKEQSPGVFVFDLGQNISGVVRLKVKGKAGDKVTIRHAEVLHKDGRLSTENLRCARAVDTYTLKGDPNGETWSPQFTYHGFQYVELTGYPGKPGLDAVTGLVMHSDVPITSKFECSDPMLNQLYSNIVWTQRANFFEMPTDCPQRDERMGWTGDAQIYVRAATYNADILAFYRKWLRDLNDDQWDYGAYPNFAPRPFARPNETHASAWMDAGIICPWTLWQVYGDLRLVEEHWRNMVKFMDFRAARDPELKGATDDCGYGDWLSLGDVKTPIPFIDLAYHAYDARLMAAMASALDKREDAARFKAQWEKVRGAFQKQYVNGDGSLKVNNQSAYAMALFFDLIPEDKRAAAADRLVGLIKANGNKMTTGFLGTRPLLPVLSATGHHDIAGILIQQKEFPSWGYEVVNGATTIWERWNSYTKEEGVHEPSMNSFSHYSFGAVCEWLMGSLVGLDLLKPGYDEILVRPRPTGTITHASGTTVTRHGPLSCSWKLEGDRFTAEVVIPPGPTARIVLPTEGMPQEGGQPADKAKGIKANADGSLSAGSGTYRFSGKYKP